MNTQSFYPEVAAMRHTLLSRLSFPILLLLLASPAFAQVIFDVHEPVSSIDITTDGKKLAIAGRTIGWVYDIQSKMIDRVFDHFEGYSYSDTFRSIKFSHAPNNVFLCFSYQVWKYRNYVNGMDEYFVHADQNNWVFAISKNTRRMVVGGNYNNCAIKRSIPDTSRGFFYYNVFSHPSLGGPLCADISPNGNRVIAGYQNGWVLVWDYNPNVQTVTKPTMTITLHKNTVYDIHFNPVNPNQFLSAAWSGTARLWDATTGKNIMVFNPRSGGIRCCAFSPDGRLVATGGADRKARLWLTASGAHLREFVGHTDLVTAVMFTPDGRQLVTASYDGTVRFWPI